MQKVLVSILVSAIVLVSCKKDDTGADPIKDAMVKLQGKYLVCDSVKTTINGITTKQVLGKGKGWDRMFGIYADLEIYSNPTVYKSFSYESPNKIYIWDRNGTYSKEQFYTINSAVDNKLVLVETEKGTGKVYTEYFTAE
ncbi:hypothetical protein [Segetibacter aerophilus]|uniref:Lipocalin-like domain-containing protein n=1 Tax=Segetibacter aerophilus TaxID=670293 RepID=A0A512BD09_9BACT|nr:hypothetical protein [Segetibacter aerophilus]GEO09852.1 hypothetical protein SAE01_23480 [Segetibacter aerophilus]